MISLMALVLTCFLALASQAEAQPYHFRTVDVPCAGCTRTIVTGLSVQDDILGTYTDAALNTHGFLWTHQGDFVPFILVQPQAVNSAGVTAGWFQQGGQQLGFTFHDGTLRRLEGIGLPAHDYATSLTVEDLNDAGQVVGAFVSPVDGLGHGFRYDLTTNGYTVIDVPGAFRTSVNRIDPQGRLLGRTQDVHGTSRYFLWTQGVFTFPAIPGRPGAALTALTASGLLGGNWGGKGFIFDGTTVEALAVPGAQSTALEGLREDGTAHGQYRAGGATHGFIATPTGGHRRSKR